MKNSKRQFGSLLYYETPSNGCRMFQRNAPNKERFRFLFQVHSATQANLLYVGDALTLAPISHEIYYHGLYYKVGSMALSWKAGYYHLLSVVVGVLCSIYQKRLNVCRNNNNMVYCVPINAIYKKIYKDGQATRH